MCIQILMGSYLTFAPTVSGLIKIYFERLSNSVEKSGTDRAVLWFAYWSGTVEHVFTWGAFVWAFDHKITNWIRKIPDEDLEKTDKSSNLLRYE